MGLIYENRDLDKKFGELARLRQQNCQTGCRQLLLLIKSRGQVVGPTTQHLHILISFVPHVLDCCFSASMLAGR